MIPTMEGIALVTGAASGNGAATVCAFIRAGVTCISIADVQADKLEALKAEFAKDNKLQMLLMVCNVADSAADKGLITSTKHRSKFGRVDYAVDSAGVSCHPCATAQVTDENWNWNWTFAINQIGVFYCLREQVGAMPMAKQDLLEGPDDQRRKQGGAIVNISSIARPVGVNGLLSYVASKHAVMTQNPEMSANVAGTMPPIPMGLNGRPEEIADVAVFLFSEGASFVNGATWPVDGGYTWL